MKWNEILTGRLVLPPQLGSRCTGPLRCRKSWVKRQSSLPVSTCIFTHGHELWVVTEKDKGEMLSHLGRAQSRTTVLRSRGGSWGGLGNSFGYQEEARGRPKIRWRVYMSQWAWEHLEILPEELEEMSGKSHPCFDCCLYNPAPAKRRPDKYCTFM